MTQDAPGKDPVGEDARIKSLEKRIAQAEHDEAVRTRRTQARGTDDSYNLGNRVLGELIGGLAGGALIGWLLDRWIGTSPWLLLVFLASGIFVAFRNIIRISTKRPDK